MLDTRSNASDCSSPSSDAPEHVQRACAILVRQAERYLPPAGFLHTSILRTARRKDSTIYLIQLDNAAGQRRFCLKTLNSDGSNYATKLQELRTEYRILQELSTRFTPYPHLGVVTPVALMIDDLSFLMEESPGSTLASILPRLRRFVGGESINRGVRLCRLAGEWLRRFQGFTALPQSARYDPSEILEYCDERIRMIGNGRGCFAQQRVNSIRPHLEYLVSSLQPDELRLTDRHNDFRPENMVAGEGRLTVLDFTGFTSGPVLYDFIKFWMRLDYLGFGLAPSGITVARLKRAFTEGYGQSVDLRSAMATLLRLANLLDTLSELAESRALRLGRRMVERLWQQHLWRQVEVILDRQPRLS